jgi:hypothetical protein
VGFFLHTQKHTSHRKIFTQWLKNAVKIQEKISYSFFFSSPLSCVPFPSLLFITDGKFAPLEGV